MKGGRGTLAALLAAAFIATGACGGDGAKAQGKPATSAAAPKPTDVVFLSGFDPASGTLRYQATQRETSPVEVVKAVGPVHTASVAKDAIVLSAVSICSGEEETVDGSGAGTKRCTLQQLAAALGAGRTSDAYAYLAMRGDTVVKITEVFHS